MTIETLKSPNPRNRNSISVVKSKFLSVSSMNTLLAIFKVTDTRRDVILAGGLYTDFLGDTSPPPGRALFMKSIYVSLDGHQFLYSLVRFPRVHSLFIYSICLFIYIVIIFSPKRRNKEFFLIDWNISETWTRIKFKQLSKLLLGSFSEKKNALFLRGRSCYYFFSVK